MTSKVLVTGASGFVGKNLCVQLRQRKDIEVIGYDLDAGPAVLARGLAEASIVIHLAGVNRPQDAEEFATGNVGFLEEVLRGLAVHGRRAKVVLSSSIQAEFDNPYGRSKRAAEEALRLHCQATGAEGVVYRLKNLFGKWCRPNYNSVVATFANAIANDLPFRVSDPANEVELTYIDDVVAAFLREIDAAPAAGFRYAEPLPSQRTTLGELVTLLRSFRSHRETLLLPDYSSPLVRALYATFLTYLKPETLGYGLERKTDPRGSLAEFVKSSRFGQIFISRTKPGITRGNHYHHTKCEKFMVLEGQGLVRIRQIESDQVLEFCCRGEEYRVVDIPPGYTHSIENVGTGEMVTLFWSSEVFDAALPDTLFEPVLDPRTA